MNIPDDMDEVSRLRIPPHSVEAEQAVLGGLMLDTAAFDRIGTIVSAKDFYRHEHRTIFEAIAAQAIACRQADVLTVLEALKAAGKADECGGLKYLNDLVQSVPSASGVKRYAEIVAERAACRALIAAGDEAASMGFDLSVPFAEKLDKVGTMIASLQRGSMRKEPRRIDALAAAAVDRYSDMAEGNVPPGIPTGIPPLDRILHGLKRGKSIGVAARPSVGKSSVARALALNAAGAGYTVLVLSQEMPGDEVADCLISQVGQIDSEHLQTGKLTDQDWGALTGAIESLRGMPLHIDDEGGLTINDIRNKARMVKGLDLLVLDYLQLSVSTIKNGNTNDQVAEISKGLKKLAMELNIPIIVLSQLSRVVEQRTDKEPQLSDLRDSGAIEQDLDIAILLWTVEEEEGADTRLVGWKVAKHRGGRKGRFGMRFKPAIYQWRESAEPLHKQRMAGGVKGGFE